MDENYDDAYGADNEKLISFLKICINVFKVMLLVGVASFMLYAILYY